MGAFWTKAKDTGPTSHTRLIDNGSDDALDEFGAILAPSDKATVYPKSVFYILITEICERFSFYGMKTILIFYLKYRLLYTEDTATVLYHSFTMLCYFTPILGAMLADLSLGRYRTILWLSSVYLVGNFLISLSAVTPLLPAVSAQNVLAIVGLVLVAVGTGGIKPCVSAFGGDQFQLPQQQKMLSQFFSIFYFCINFGSLFSTLITPLLRENTQCFGDDCYFGAFLLPAILMAVALGVYAAGSSSYKKVPASGTILTSTVACIWLGAVGKVRSLVGRAPCMVHWLDHARAEYDDDLVEDVRALTAIMWLYLPLPFFWALFDQQGSRWTFQAARMDGHIGSMTVQPDQVQVINPILILVLVPAMERWGYPLLGRAGLLTSALQRVVVGGLLAAVAFAAATLVEYWIEVQQATSGPELSIAWLIPQYFLITMGEVLFSISGLQFSFTEAPASMKSVVQACWLLTISVGNLLVVFVAHGQRANSQTEEFALFSCLMFVDMLVFAVMAFLYKPYKPVKMPTPPNPVGSSSSSYNTTSSAQPSTEDDPTLYTYDNLRNKYEPSLDDEEENVYNSADYVINNKDYEPLDDGASRDAQQGRNSS